MKKLNMSFRTSYLAAGVLPTLIGVVFTSIILTSTLETQVKGEIVNELKVATQQVDEYFSYDIDSKGEVDYEEYADHSYVESLQGDNIELTLFKDDTRFITSLKNADGSYNEGTQAAADIYATVHAGNDYTAENVTINGTDYFVYYSPIYTDEGEFWGMAFAGEPQADVKALMNKTILKVVIIAISMIVGISLILVVISSKLSRMLCNISTSLNKLAQGDLNTPINIPQSGVKEFNSLIDSTTTLYNQLINSVGGAKTAADNLRGTVTKVEDLSSSSADGALQISQAVNELAMAAQTMAESVQDANSAMVEMGLSIDRISGNVTDMNVSSKASKEANEVAMEYMNKLTEASKKSAQTVGEISQKVTECSESAEKIKKATEAIGEIASQTNLLSLNASIEAAHAGEAGKGFAVVATSIQKLAEQSNESANDIGDIIEEILVKVEECVEKAKEMTSVINNQMTFLEETCGKIDMMSSTGTDLAEGASAINNETVELVKFKEKVLSAISDLSAISEENAASAEEVTASVESIAAAAENTKNESANMQILADDLNNRMEFFKL